MARGGNAPLQDTILYDRIEVVRGATGLMGGKGDPSATINMIRKRPTKEFQASAGLIMGRWDDQRFEADERFGVEGDNGLIEYAKLLSFDGPPQVVFEFEQCHGACVHSVVKQFMPCFAVTFRTIHRRIGVA